MSTFKIKPYPHVAVYPTGWTGEITYEQIYDDLAHYASNVMKSYGMLPHEIPDCLQIGFTVLWETLVAQPDFLKEKTRRQTVFFVLARCKISSMRSKEQRCDSLDALISDDWHNTADEHLIDGLQHRHGERWAGWATEIDLRVDIERIMTKLAAKYADSFTQLVALYDITTQVSRSDSACLVGLSKWNWYKNHVLPVLHEVQYEFAEVFLEQHSYAPAGEPLIAEATPNQGRFTSPYWEWREQYEQGHTAPADVLLERYGHTGCTLEALRAQLAGMTYEQAARDNGRNPKTFPRYMKKAARLLAAAYAA